MIKSELENISIYIRKTFLSGAGKNVVIGFVSLSFIPLIINEMGMVNFGVVAILFIFGNFNFLLDFGFSKSVTYLVGTKRSNENEIVSFAIINSFGLFALLLTLAFIANAFSFSPYGKIEGVSNELTKNILLLSMLLLGINQVSSIFVGYLDAKHLAYKSNVGFMLNSIFTNFILYICAYLSVELENILFFFVLAHLVNPVYLLFITKTQTPFRFVIKGKLDFALFYKTSFDFFKVSIFNLIQIPINKFLIINLTSSPILMGVFEISLRVALFANGFLNALSFPLLGVFSGIKENTSNIFKIALNLIKVTFLFYCIGVFLFLITGHWISSLFSEIDNSFLFWAMLLLIIGVCSTGVAEPAHKALLALDRINQIVLNRLFTILLNVILLLFLLNQSDSTLSVFIAYSVSLLISSCLFISLLLRNHWHEK